MVHRDRFYVFGLQVFDEAESRNGDDRIEEWYNSARYNNR